MKNKGFTLIELLAVIVILAVILTITVPRITAIVQNASKSSFESDAKMVLKAIDYQKLQDDSFDPTSINRDTVSSILKLSNSNYDSVNLIEEDNDLIITIVGSNKWNGLVACGTYHDLRIVTSSSSCNSDVIPPVISIIGDVLITLNVGETYSDAGSSALDNKDGDITNKILSTGNVNPNVPGVYTITYNVSDSSGNVAYPVVRTINVVDVNAPTLTVLGDNPANINVGTTYSDAGASAIDDVDGDITSEIAITGTINPNVPGTYTITYTVKDSSGNEVIAIRTINVIDNVPPTVVFSMNGNSTYAKTRSTKITVSDAHSSINTSSLKYQWTTSITTPTEDSFSTTFTNGDTLSTPAGVTGGYYLWILAKDTANNTIITRSNVFNLDNVIPVITMNGASQIVIAQGSTYSDAGSSATDNIDNSVPVTVTGTVNPSVQGSYSITYNATDDAGNAALSVVRKIDVTCYSFTVATGTITDYSDSCTKAPSIPSQILSVGVTNIASMAFNSNNLTGVTIPNTVTSIGESAFSQNQLTSLSIPSSVTYIGPYAFNINQLPDAQAFIYKRNANGTNDTTTIVSYGGATLNNVVVPTGVTTIETYAFTDVGISSITLPNTLVTIKSYAFMFNPLSSGIFIPNAVTYIGQGAFYYTNLTQGKAFIDNYSTNVTLASDAFNVTPIFLMDEFIASEGVNKPKLATGMTPIKWNGSAWVTTTEDDTDWYNYTTVDKKWANARTTDGSMWVWIPRYAYQLASNYHTLTAGTVNIKFLRGTSNRDSSNNFVATTPTYSGSSQTNYITHPAFTFGTTEVTGIWVAKFEATAVEGLANPINIASDWVCPVAGDNVTSKTVKIIPNANSWRCIDIGNAFNVTRAMETKSIYGWGTSGSGIDTHPAKNTEWGAATYLSKSAYGQNTNEIWANNNSNMITGCAGNSVSEAAYAGCQNAYQTTNGVKASTTGNIYGIYDMSGGAWEWGIGYVDNGNAELNTTAGLVIKNANSKYKDMYPVGSPDTAANNYGSASSIKGDAIYETSSTTNGNNGWFTDTTYMPLTSTPFFIRGLALGGTGSGPYAFYGVAGSAHIRVAFRPVLLVTPGL